MKVLILGATGMLGSAVWRAFAERPAYEVIGTARTSHRAFLLRSQREGRLLWPIYSVGAILAACREEQPEIIINCVGLVRQLSHKASAMVELNALLPHLLGEWCRASGAYLVHISTDCVFSGKAAWPVGYTERDIPDPDDIYGASKWLGEVTHDAVTLRTSFIGHELEPDKGHGLLEWFLRSDEPCQGWTGAVWSGMTSDELARVIVKIVLPMRLQGLFHVAGEPIAKYVLLQTLGEVYRHERPITPMARPVLDRTLNANLFWRQTGAIRKPLRTQLEEMANARAVLLPVAAKD